jgi:hypothetical protein
VNNKNLITSAFPRSGSTFLNFSLKSLYYNEEPNINFHTTVSINKYEKIIVPFRNPTDSIASWNLYPSNHPLEMDIKYYIRFYTEALNKSKKVIFFDFNKFTIDLEYIKRGVYENFNIEPINQTTIQDIKASMVIAKKDINLPRNNKKELDIIKQELYAIPAFDECQELYKRLLETDKI